jgi:hypothetical protein
MGYIKEPKDVDFFVDSKPLSMEDRKRISELIAFYKRTGKKLLKPKVKPSKVLASEE